MEIDNKKIQKWIEEGREFNLLDVRRDDERELVNLSGIHIPLHELEARYTEIPRGKVPLVVYCHHGVRSLYATQFLKMHGYDALSLRGGIDAWSIEIDTKVPRY